MKKCTILILLSVFSFSCSHIQLKPPRSLAGDLKSKSLESECSGKDLSIYPYSNNCTEEGFDERSRAVEAFKKYFKDSNDCTSTALTNLLCNGDFANKTWVYKPQQKVSGKIVITMDFSPQKLIGEGSSFMIVTYFIDSGVVSVLRK